MKIARFVLKIVAAAMALIAVVCAMVAFWDRIVDLFYTVAEIGRASCRDRVLRLV